MPPLFVLDPEGDISASLCLPGDRCDAETVEKTGIL